VSDSESEASAAPESSTTDAGASVSNGDKPLILKDEIRVVWPPEGTEVPPIDVVRMRDGPGMPRPVVLADADEPGSLSTADADADVAERHLGKGDTEEARKIGATLQADAERVDLGRTITIRAHLMDGNLDAARADMGAERDSASMALADAALALGEGDVARANKRMAEALAATPDGVAEHYTLALIQVAEGKVGEAITTLGSVAASMPEHAVARHQLGQLTLAAGDPARAGTLFEMALQLAPEFAPPALALAEMLVDSRQYAEAMNVLGGVTTRMPNALAPRLLQLRILIEVGEKEPAESLATALRAAAPDHPDVIAIWAEARLLVGKGDEAREELERFSASQVGEPKARMLRLLSRCDLAAIPQRSTEAIVHLVEAIGHAAAPGELRLELVQLHLGMSQHEQAVEVLDDLQRDGRTELGDLLNGAVAARNHGLWACARRLADTALQQVAGTPSEGQIAAFRESLPDTE